MHYTLFRWFPHHAVSRLMGGLADTRWPGWLLRPMLKLYVRLFRVDMGEAAAPLEHYACFTDFFVRALKPGLRPVDPDAAVLVSPVDGTADRSGTIEQGRLIQAKGLDYSLADLLDGDPDWARYQGGSYLTLYLSPGDYHRIHSPCAGRVTRFRHVPGELWSVMPAAVRTVPGLFARNERIVTFIATAFGEVALVAVGATVVGRIRVVYHGVTSHRRGAAPLAETLAEPYALAKGQEVGRFELGSTVILLFRPGEVALQPPAPGEPIRLGEVIGRVIERENNDNCAQ